ncbi:hypothetical protein IWX49DRAFT_372886 [Phyllosticta citricarpa]|uniref:Secreted protein n=1 Tax=Phyllosticta citricarpa TaxID=55181 RepID=A0ABR1MIR9_9PEZI
MSLTFLIAVFLDGHFGSRQLNLCMIHLLPLDLACGRLMRCSTRVRTCGCFSFDTFLCLRGWYRQNYDCPGCVTCNNLLSSGRPRGWLLKSWFILWRMRDSRFEAYTRIRRLHWSPPADQTAIYSVSISCTFLCQDTACW